MFLVLDNLICSMDCIVLEVCGHLLFIVWVHPIQKLELQHYHSEGICGPMVVGIHILVLAALVIIQLCIVLFIWSSVLCVLCYVGL